MSPTSASKDGPLFECIPQVLKNKTQTKGHNLSRSCPDPANSVPVKNVFCKFAPSALGIAILKVLYNFFGLPCCGQDCYFHRVEVLVIKGICLCKVGPCLIKCRIVSDFSEGLRHAHMSTL